MENISNYILKSLVTIFIVFTLTNLFSSCMNMNPGMKMKTDMKDHGIGIVKIKYNMYSPESITVPVNTIVTWVNKDWWSHTIKSDSALFDSGKLKCGKVFNYKFTTKGTYKYQCEIHDKMVGSVIVE